MTTSPLPFVAVYQDFSLGRPPGLQGLAIGAVWTIRRLSKLPPDCHGEGRVREARIAGSSALGDGRRCVGRTGRGDGPLSLAIPRRLSPTDPDRLAVGASWRPPSSPRSVCTWVCCGCSMAMLALNADDDAGRASGLVRAPAAFLQGAFVLASAFVFYLLVTVCTLTWIATRGQRFCAVEPSRRTSACRRRLE